MAVTRDSLVRIPDNIQEHVSYWEEWISGHLEDQNGEAQFGTTIFASDLKERDSSLRTGDIVLIFRVLADRYRQKGWYYEFNDRYSRLTITSFPIS